MIDLRDDITQRTAAYVVATDGYQSRPKDMGALNRCVTALQVWGSNLDTPDWAGVTCVHRLAAGLHAEALEVLLRCGADPDITVPASGMVPCAEYATNMTVVSSIRTDAAAGVGAGGGGGEVAGGGDGGQKKRTARWAHTHTHTHTRTRTHARTHRHTRTTHCH